MVWVNNGNGVAVTSSSDAEKDHVLTLRQEFPCLDTFDDGSFVDKRGPFVSLESRDLRDGSVCAREN